MPNKQRKLLADEMAKNRVIRSASARKDIEGIPVGSAAMYEGQRVRVINAPKSGRDVSKIPSEYLSAFLESQKKLKPRKTIGAY